MSGKSKAIVPMLFMALFWNGLVGTFDAAIGYQFYRQYDARARYEPVEAHVERSEVCSNSSSDGSTYSALIEFRYEFEGVLYRSDRHAFFSISTSDRSFAARACERFPVGASVTGYVDPDDPTEAVLDTSSQSFPAMILLFLTPFNLIGLAIIGLVVATFRQKKSEEQLLRERFVVIDTGDHVVFGKQRMSAALVALIAMTILSFLANFAVLPFRGFGASLGEVGFVLAVCASLSVGFAAWRVKKAKAPKNFLHIDRTRGTFSFPANEPGAPLESIQSIVHEPESTGVTINDVVQYKHTFKAETPSGIVGLFEVRSSREEGDAVLDLLRNELLDGTLAGSGDSAA